MQYPLNIIIFGLFLFTIHPSITAGDSGEIVAAAFSLGIPHPPGYPLYLAFAKFFTFVLPFGNLAYRVNIVSAVFGALSCWMVYLITRRIVRSSEFHDSQCPAPNAQPSPLFAASSLALSYELWYRSTVAEVYTLNAFLVLLIIYILLVWRKGHDFLSHDPRLLCLAAFLFGLGIGNHHTIVLILPGAIVFVLWSSLSSGNSPFDKGGSGGFARLTSHVSCLIFFLLLGLSVYLYLPIRSLQNPFMDWGDPQDFKNFIDVFTRKTYLPEGFERGWEMLLEQLGSFNPIAEFKFIGALLTLAGAYGLFRDKAILSMLLVTLLLASYGLIFLAGSSTKDVELLRKFYLPSYIIFPIFIGIGITTVLKSNGQWAAFLVSILMLLSLLWQFATHYPMTGNSDNYLAYDYGMNELNSLNYGSVYISKGEKKTFPLWYMQGLERYREDVKVITAYFLPQGWYAEKTLGLVGAIHGVSSNLTYKQILINSIYEGNEDKGVYAGFLNEEYIPRNLYTATRGITFRLYKTAVENGDADVWPRYQLRGVKRVDEGMERGIKEILKDYASSYYNTGIEYYEKGDKERAITDFEESLTINPDDPDALNNLAALYTDKGIRLKEAEDMAGRAVELYREEKDREIAKETLREILERRKK